MRTIVFVLVFAVIGLAIGYGILGKIAGHYVSLDTLLSSGGNAFQSALKSVAGIESMRNNILLCGAAGAVAGLLLGLSRK